jgi:hypothetical protein
MSNTNKVSRQEARRDLCIHLEAAQQRLKDIRDTINSYLLGMELDIVKIPRARIDEFVKNYEPEYIEQQACDQAAVEISALDGGLSICEEAVKQLYDIVWLEL